MKTKMRLISAVVALLFAGMPSAFAMQSSHESEWGKIKLCEKLTLAEDSAGEWGCWTEFAAPAAGPSGNYLGAPGSEAYLNNPIATQAGCPAGAMCGYAVYLNYEKSGRYGFDSFGKYRDPVYPATFIVYPQFGEQNGWGFGGLTASFELTPLSTPLSGSDPAPMFTNSGSVPLEGWYGYNPYWGGYGKADGGDGTVNASIEGSVDHAVTTWGSWPPVVQPSAVAVGDDLTSFKVFVYVTGDSSPKEYYSYMQEYYSEQGVKGAYVVGYPTTSAQMTAMNSLIGHYCGSEVLSGGNVSITANFNTASWQGSWSYGKYGYLPNWGASGNISGGNIQSTALSGAAQAGVVQGTFYGSGAQNLAGISDVNLSTYKGEGPTIRHTDLFVTSLKATSPANQVIEVTAPDK